MRKNRSAAVAAASFLLITGAAIATAPVRVRRDSRRHARQ